MSISLFKKTVLAVQKALGASAVIFKNDFSNLDNDGHVVRFKMKGYWNSLTREDVIDYATMGVTN